jgi:threonine dehydrogenase-like Zn-dependent dehydrogenase
MTHSAPARPITGFVTTLCRDGKEWMPRLVEMARSGRLDVRPLITHRFKGTIGERRDE